MFICLRATVYKLMRRLLAFKAAEMDQRQNTHELHTTKTSHSKCDWIPLIATLLVLHRNQILEPQGGGEWTEGEQTVCDFKSVTWYFYHRTLPQTWTWLEPVPPAALWS